MQYWVREEGVRVVVVFEGRDAAGKGGTIKRIMEPLNPRQARIAALPAPTEREQTQWYFQRYIAHLPAAGEIVLFDRSWYNRAGVERVLGFCTPAQHQLFLRQCPTFERMLIEDGILLTKYWFSVSDEEQLKRFRERIKDETKRWKLSPMDLESRSHYIDYSRAKDEMFVHTDLPESPWFVVEADDKRRARLNCISHFLSRIPYEDRDAGAGGAPAAPVRGRLPPARPRDAEVRARSRRVARLRSWLHVPGAGRGVLARVLADERVPRRRERDRDAGRDARRPARAGGRALGRLQHARAPCWSAPPWPTRSRASSRCRPRAGWRSSARGRSAATIWNVARGGAGCPPARGTRSSAAWSGAAVATTGLDGVNWGGLDGWRPVGVFGVLIALAVSPVIGFVFGTRSRGSSTALRRGRRAGWRGPVRAGEWVMSAALSFSHGANDAQKAMGVTAALLRRRTAGSTRSRCRSGSRSPPARRSRSARRWAGGRSSAPIGRRIFHLHPIDGFSSQTASTAVILASSYVGAPGVDHPRRRLVGRRRRGRPAALAPCTLGGRAHDGVRMARDVAGCRPSLGAVHRASSGSAST